MIVVNAVVQGHWTQILHNVVVLQLLVLQPMHQRHVRFLW